MRLLFLILLMAWAGSGLTAGAPASPPAKGEYKLGDRLPSNRASQAEPAYKQTAWEDLVPASWDPKLLFKDIDLSSMDDGDPRAMRALERLRAEWNAAPTNPQMDGARVRIPGFIVPLERKGDLIREFLLVPYFGACIHTPPPPSNQIIHVFLPKPVKFRSMDAVWVNGVLEIGRSETGMGAAGYRLKAAAIALYKG